MCNAIDNDSAVRAGNLSEFPLKTPFPGVYYWATVHCLSV